MTLRQLCSFATPGDNNEDVWHGDNIIDENHDDEGSDDYNSDGDDDDVQCFKQVQCASPMILKQL